MKAIVLLVVLCGCSAQTRFVERVSAPAPRAPQGALRAEQIRGEATDDGATRAFLEREIERLERQPAPAPTRESAPVIVYESQPRVEYRRRFQGSFVPVRAFWGGLIGAAAGRRHGHRGRHIAVGAGIGLLFDVMAWSRY